MMHEKTLQRYLCGDINYRQAKFIMSSKFSSDKELDDFIEKACVENMNNRKWLVKTFSKLLLVWTVGFIFGALLRFFM